MKTHNLDKEKVRRTIFSAAAQGAVYATGRVNEVKTPVLIDTGSAVTIIHRKLWERGRKKGSPELRKSSEPVVVANGEPLQIIGAAEVVIQVADTNFTHEALVTDEIFQECLLGADFLVPNGFVIDFKTGLLHHGTSTTALTQAETTQIRRVCRVSLANTSVIRAGEERLLWGDVHHPHDTTLKYAGVMEPKEGFEARHQALVARVVAVPDGKIVPVRVANLSPVPITLY